MPTGVPPPCPSARAAAGEARRGKAGAKRGVEGPPGGILQQVPNGVVHQAHAVVEQRSVRLHQEQRARGDGSRLEGGVERAFGIEPDERGGVATVHRSPVACDVDLAVGCGYKYLSGGPGAPAFLFVARRLQEELRSPLSGWMGHASPFTFERQFRSAPGVLRFLCGTPSVLGLSVLDSALDVLLAADMEHLTRKGRALGDLFIRLIVEGNHDLELASPRESTCRGNQVAIRHPQGYAIIQAMIAQSVIGDFRAPDVMRFGFAPLYVRYQDVWRAAQILFSVLEGKSWMGTNFSRRATVT